MQVTRYNTPLWAAQASFEERSNLSDGQNVVRPTFAKFYADDYTRGSDMTEQGYTMGTETLSVTSIPAILSRVDDFDELQSNYNLQGRVAKDGMRAINEKIDAEYCAQVTNATHSIDAGDVGGTAGSAIVLDETNILKVFAAAARKLHESNVDLTGMEDPRVQAGNMKPGGKGGFANLPPTANELLALSLSGRETVNGDQMGKSGYVRTYFGFDVYVTNSGYWVGVLGMATNPTDGDTIVINGVTLTFKATLGTTAGNVHICSDADATRLNLATFLTTPGTSIAEATDTGAVALSAADQAKLKRMTFTDSASANTLTVAAKGYGHVVVSETFTDATDAWTSETSYMMFGVKGAVDLVMQDQIKVKFSDIPKQHGVYIKPRALYGLKTFTEGADQLVSVEVNTASWS